MRKTISSILAALFVAAALAPMDARAQNTTAPAAPPTAQATPPAIVPAKAPGKRYMSTRTGKFRNRQYRNMYWRTGGNNFRATNMRGTPGGHAAWHNGTTATTAKSGTAFVGTTNATATHHQAVAGKSKSTTGTKHDAPKTPSVKS